ncbi:MAG: transposase [Saprospiraceae bacterium]|nr:transposase [Saprospiraceae bacterium]
MQFVENQLFHVYNRGNNRQAIFFHEDNYYFFMEKMRSHLLPVCDLLAYCLMPNHFHLLIRADERTITQVAKNQHDLAVTAFSKGMRIMLSSYAKAIHKQEGRTGSLFQQKTKSKQVSSLWSWEDYSMVCLRYILQNPVKAGLAERPEDWPFSNFRDLAGLRKGSLCNHTLLEQELGLSRALMLESVHDPIDPLLEKKIW